MINKKLLINLHWFFASQLGLDPQRLYRSITSAPQFIHDLRKFRRSYSGTFLLKPCLQDRKEEGGVTKSEYFWQDLLVARWIHEANPDRHVDIGSRIDGFVAHVASFRRIEVFDVRPVSTHVDGIRFRKIDIMNFSKTTAVDTFEYCDSLSCLHALEHFGLGRYGDPIDPSGYQHGIANMARLLKVGGTFYLSTPIGDQRVEFNANWVFDPMQIINLATLHRLTLITMKVVDQKGIVTEVQASDTDAIRNLGTKHYNLGIFVFRKIM